MKKYIKPAVEVVELSVKESLSDLPALTKFKLTRKAATINSAITWYGDEFSTPTTTTPVNG